MDKSTSAFHLCQDFQRSEIPLPHLILALTAKDVKFASSVPPYVLVMHSHTNLYVFRETSQVKIKTT